MLLLRLRGVLWQNMGSIFSQVARQLKISDAFVTFFFTEAGTPETKNIITTVTFIDSVTFLQVLPAII